MFIKIVRGEPFSGGRTYPHKWNNNNTFINAYGGDDIDWLEIYFLDAEVRFLVYDGHSVGQLIKQENPDDFRKEAEKLLGETIAANPRILKQVWQMGWLD